MCFESRTPPPYLQDVTKFAHFFFFEGSPKQNYHLSMHTQSVHFKEKHPCNTCDYEAPTKPGLQRHVRNVHQKSENINCQECSKTIQKPSLKKHMKLIHSVEPPKLSCKICIFQTIHRNNLNAHIKKVFLLLLFECLFLPCTLFCNKDVC